MLCCSLNLQRLECLAAELVDTEAAAVAAVVAARTRSRLAPCCRNEPPRKCTAKEDKTDCVIRQLFSPASLTAPRSRSRRKQLIDKRNSTVVVLVCGGGSGRDGVEGEGVFTKAHVENLPFSTRSTVCFFRLWWQQHWRIISRPLAPRWLYSSPHC